MTSSAKPLAFQYEDYRLFVKDRYAYLRSVDSKMTTTVFARISGLKSRAHLNLIISGERNIRDETIEKLGEAFETSTQEQEFFYHLVHFNQAEDSKKRQIHKRQMVRILGLPPSKKFSEAHFQIFSSWRIPAVYEFIHLTTFSGSRQALYRGFAHILSEDEVDQALRTLEDLNLINQSSGQIHLREAWNVIPPDPVPYEVFHGYYKDLFKLSLGAIEQIPAEKRSFSGLTVGLNEEAYQKVQELLAQVEAEVADLQSSASSTDTVYQVGFQLFPLAQTKNIKKA